MCIAPLKILNRSHNQVAGLTPRGYTVPCGKCWQCQSARRDTYLVRNFYEYLKCQTKGGNVLFLTLTYRNSTLPHVKDVPVFCKSDIQKYVKRFRINLTRQLARSYRIYQYVASDMVKNSIKYFVSSENGETTHRPHYHILIYCSNPRISKWIVRKIAMSSWQLGFVKTGEENYGFVTSIKAIKYVTKYVGKSIIDEKYYHDLLEKYKDTDIYQKLLENKPFLLSSQQLGMFATSLDCPPQYRLTEQMFYDNKVLLQDDDKVVVSKPLPQYYKRKFCFDVYTQKIGDKYKVEYRINDFGIEFKKRTYQNRLEQFKRNLDVVLSYPIPNVDAFTKQCCDTFGKGLTYDYIKEFLNRYTRHDKFPEYALLYSNYSYFLDETDLKAVYHGIDPIHVEFFRNHVNYTNPEYAISYSNIDDYYDFYLKLLENIFYFHNQYPQFEKCLIMLEFLLFHINKFKTEKQTVKDKTVYDNRQ